MRSGVDNNILVWRMRTDLNPVDDSGRDVADLQRRARILFAEMEEKPDWTIVIPSVVIAEFLCGIAPERHGDVIAVLQERFFCPPFDIHAAAMSAGLFRYGRSIQEEVGRPKRLLKLDTMVVASAKVAGCSIFYSNDERCRKLATRSGMIAKDLPTHSANMFIDKEAKKTSTGTETFPFALGEDLPPFSLKGDE